jgi:hypothetical protein
MPRKVEAQPPQFYLATYGEASLAALQRQQSCKKADANTLKTFCLDHLARCKT